LIASVLELLVVSTEELLPFGQPFGAKPLLKVLEVVLKPRAKNFEISMPAPEVLDSILSKPRNLVPNFCSQITICLA